MTAFGERAPKAFVSWAHSDDAWRDTIARFVVALREFGIDADVDLFHAHDGSVDWSTYGPNAIEENDFVLLAASAAYKQRWEEFRTTRTGAGAAREANVLKALFDRDQAAFFKKVIVVVLPGARDADIPNELVAGLPRFVISEFDERHLEDLLRRLTGQPAFVPAPPGQVPILPPEIGGPVKTAEASGERAANEEVASNLKQRLEQLDKSIAATPAGAEDARSDEKAERSALSAALKAITNRPHGNPRLPPTWRLAVVVGAVVLAVVAVVAVPGGGGAPPAEVKVGAIYSLSGAGGEAGKEALDGVRFAVEYINGGDDPESTLPLKAGGGLPRLDGAKLKLVRADVGSVRCESQPAFNRLVDRDRVVAVVGAYESTVTLQALIAANRRQVPLVNESATAPSLTEPSPETRAGITACGVDPDPRPSPWFFRVGPSDTQAAEHFFTLIEEAERSGKIRPVGKVAILHENNDIYGNAGAAITKKLAQRRGVTVRRFRYPSVLGRSAPRSGSSCTVKERTFTKLRLRVRQMTQFRPDVVFALGYRPDAIAAVQMMQKLGYVPPALLAYGGGFASRTFNSSVKAGNPACDLPRADPSGIVARVAWSPDSESQSQTARRIAQLFRQRYKRPMTPTAASGFTAMLTLAQAINDAGSTDPTKIRKALRALDVPTNETIMPWTGVRFNAHGQNTRARFVLQQIIRGSYRVVYPADVATADAIWPLAKARN